MNIGILALQGDISEHVAALEGAIRQLGMDGTAVQVRRPSELERVSALLMPGGESTTVSKQLDRFGLRQPIVEFANSGHPVMGTCAGSILLSTEILDQRGQRVEPLGLIDIAIRRNAFGRQIDSFEKPLRVKGLDAEFPGIFIRAPRIEKLGEGVESMAKLGEEHVMVSQKNVMALTFHPELSDDFRIHAMFLRLLMP